MVPLRRNHCQEIGLVAFMFFFELLFSYVSSSIPFYVSLANLFSIISFPYLPITRDIQDKEEARFRFHQYRNSLKIILRLEEPLRILKPTSGSTSRPVLISTLEFRIHHLHISVHLDHRSFLHSINSHSSQEGIPLLFRETNR